LGDSTQQHQGHSCGEGPRNWPGDAMLVVNRMGCPCLPYMFPLYVGYIATKPVLPHLFSQSSFFSTTSFPCFSFILWDGFPNLLFPSWSWFSCAPSTIGMRVWTHYLVMYTVISSISYIICLFVPEIHIWRYSLQI
jgi:hypothetical protein